MSPRFYSRTDELLLTWTLLAKLGVLLIGIAAFAAANGNAPWLLEPWHRWDAPHYTDIAVWGYMANDRGTLSVPGYEQVFPGDLDLYIVFFPLFPWLVAGVNAVIGAPIVAAFAVSSIASLFVAPMLFRLVAEDCGDRIGLWAAGFLLIFPTAYFLHIGYTEGLFLALAFGSMWLARTDRWWLAGLLGGLAALTRINGLVLLLALPVEAATQFSMQPPGERRFRWRWLAIGLVGLGFAIYLALNYAIYGTPFQFMHVQESHWFKSLAAPWDSSNSALGWFGDPKPDSVLMYGFMELLFVAIGVVGTVVAAFRFRPSWFAWMAGNLVLFVSTSFRLSTPRYVLTLFPLFVALALPSRRTWVLVALSIVSIAGFIFFGSRFATGSWAF